MSRHRQTVNRLTNDLLSSMSDAELEAAAGGIEIDWSGFTDLEIEAVGSGHAGPELLARVQAVTTHPGAPG